MGFRSVFISEDIGMPVIQPWFVTKWQNLVHFGERPWSTHVGPDWPISAKREFKLYMSGAELLSDIGLLIRNGGTGEKVVLIWLHECDGISRVEIYADRLVWSEPTGWARVPDSTHDYCYGCSDVKEVEA